MFVLSNFIVAVACVIDILLTVVWWLVLIRALISWVNPDPFNPIVSFLTRVTEPILEPFRRMIPAFRTGIDLSPLLVMIAIVFIRLFLIQSLRDLAVTLR